MLKCHISLYCDVYEHGKLGISVNTSPIMALPLVLHNNAVFEIKHTIQWLLNYRELDYRDPCNTGN